MYTDIGLRTEEEIMSLIRTENKRQLNKWGAQTRSSFEWITYTMEELGELAEAIAKHEYGYEPIDYVVEEATHLATLSLKILEMANEIKKKKEEEQCKI